MDPKLPKLLDISSKMKKMTKTFTECGHARLAVLGRTAEKKIKHEKQYYSTFPVGITCLFINSILCNVFIKINTTPCVYEFLLIFHPVRLMIQFSTRMVVPEIGVNDFWKIVNKILPAISCEMSVNMTTDPYTAV